jgi:hypothetical protein
MVDLELKLTKKIDLVQLNNGEFIKLAPNPFVNQVNLDFNIKGHQKLLQE